MSCLAVYMDIDEKLQRRFPSLAAQVLLFTNVSVQSETAELEAYKDEVYEDVRSRWTVDGLKENPVFRAYRDFFWRLGIDPTKNRPAAEALIRRTLRGNPIPRINSWVDTYNLISMDTAIPIASFDRDKLRGSLLMREAEAGEEFHGIGMSKPVVLVGGEAVIEDGERLVAIYPYRDAEHSKVTLSTKNVYMLMCGAPDISLDALRSASESALKIMLKFCDGSVNL
jgi:DNA/RNA-binding domain of Phe-tRNA-synthetase-like protein